MCEELDFDLVLLLLLDVFVDEDAILDEEDEDLEGLPFVFTVIGLGSGVVLGADVTLGSCVVLGSCGTTFALASGAWSMSLGSGAGTAAGCGSGVTSITFVSGVGDGRGGGDWAFTGSTEMVSTEGLASSSGAAGVAGLGTGVLSTFVSSGLDLAASDMAKSKSKSESQVTV